MIHWQLIRAESRKLWRWYLPFLALIGIYVLGRPDPLARGDLRMAVLAALQGTLLGWRVLADPGGTQSFFWSRPLTRAQLFLNRWVLGLLFQLLTVAVVALIIAVGARMFVQGQIGGNTYYPAAHLYDLNVLYPCAFFSLFAYQIMLYLRVFAEISWGKPDSFRGGFVRGIVLAAVSVGTPLIVALWFSGPILWRAVYWYLAAGIVVIAAITAATALYAFRHVEVEP